MKLDKIADLLGCPITFSPSITVSEVSIDSRKIKPGALFVALRGDRFDGHEFMAQAVESGAAAIICEKIDSHVNVPQLMVADSLKALADIAKLHRQTIHCPVIALTGSNGKTSVKEMIANILPKPAHATPGNLNNHIGAPLSVLQLNSSHRYAVFELGANHPGEIAYTVAIVKPQVTLINNIAPAHIEGFGSIDGVANAKGEIHQGLAENGVAVINNDDEYAHFWDSIVSNKRIIRFSRVNPADIYPEAIRFDQNGCASFTLVTPAGEAEINLHVPGEHNISNALAAASCCYATGIDLTAIATGLNEFVGVAGRMTYLKGKNHAVVIDDTYNANLRSVLTALDVLAKRGGRRILVLGDMGELGDWTQQHHEEIGRIAQEHGIDMLLTCGRHSQFSSKAFGAHARHYTSQAELAQDLLPELDKNTTILVKGSRSAAMEKIVHELVG